MRMIIHDIKVAVRNIMKYKLQTLISVLSIAIGIVTLSFTHSMLENFRLPPITDEHYYEGVYNMTVTSSDNKGCDFSPEMMLALRGNGGLRNADKMVFGNYMTIGLPTEFHLTDSTVRKGFISGRILDPEYPEFMGWRSAVTGKKIKKLNPGEAIISESYAKEIFKDKDPIGAVQTSITDGQPIPLTIIDVFKSLPVTGRDMDNDLLCFGISDNPEDLKENKLFHCYMASVVIKEGKTKEQLQTEIEQRLAPWGMKVKIWKESDDDDGIVIMIRYLVYLIGSLILLAAIIGFLRMQIQLVWLRNRDMSLRIVNGASIRSLFTLLMTEVCMVLIMAVCVAVALGSFLQGFLYNDLSVFLSESGIVISDLWLFSFEIGGIILLLCALIVGFILYRINKSEKGLSVFLHRGSNHLFRNVMLGIQTFICIVFVCGSFILIHAGEKINKAYFIPDNDDVLRECLYLSSNVDFRQDEMYDAIRRLPDLDKMVRNVHAYFPIKELEDKLEIQKEIRNRTHLMTYCTDDTIFLSSLGIDVNWIDKRVNRMECVLMQKDLYDWMKDAGIIDNNTLTMSVSGNYSQTYAIAGTFSAIPYEDDRQSLIVITQESLVGEIGNWLLMSKPGKGKALARSVNETIEKFAPEVINKMLYNYREKINPLPGMVETAVKGGWILGCVSLIICIMGIFSTITLDTRARRKEVAIRKVNGAKSVDIYRMFGRVYGWLILASLVLAVPISVLFGEMLRTMMVEIDPAVATTFSPVWPIVLGCLVVIVLIVLIVGMQIRRVMGVDPSKLIAKE